MRAILYSRKLSREKTFMNFEVLWLFAKDFSAACVPNHNTSLDNGNSIRIMYVATFLLARQKLPNGST